MNPLLRSYNSRTAAILGSAECEQCGRHITTYSHSESLRGPHFCNDKCKKEYEAEQKAYCPECDYLKEYCKCPKKTAGVNWTSRDFEPKDRDVEHEQVSSSTTEELLARLEEINKRAERRWGVLLYRQDELREFQKIQSELWNRAHGKESKPFTTTSVPRDEMVRTKSGGIFNRKKLVVLSPEERRTYMNLLSREMNNLGSEYLGDHHAQRQYEGAEERAWLQFQKMYPGMREFEGPKNGSLKKAGTDDPRYLPITISRLQQIKKEIEAKKDLANQLDVDWGSIDDAIEYLERMLPKPQQQDNPFSDADQQELKDMKMFGSKKLLQHRLFAGAPLPTPEQFQHCNKTLWERPSDYAAYVDEQKKEERRVQEPQGGPRFAAFVPKKAVIDPNWEPGPGDPNYCEECEHPNNPENKYCDWCQAPMPQRQHSEKRESNPFATKHKLLNRWEDEETPVEERYPITDQDEDTLQEIYLMNAKQAGSHPKHPEAEYDPMISDENVAGFTDASGEQYHVPRKKLPEGHPHRTMNEDAPWRNEDNPSCICGHGFYDHDERGDCDICGEKCGGFMPSHDAAPVKFASDIQVRKNGKSHKIADPVVHADPVEKKDETGVNHPSLQWNWNENVNPEQFRRMKKKVSKMDPEELKRRKKFLERELADPMLDMSERRAITGELDMVKIKMNASTKKAESGPVDHIIIDGKPGEWHVHFQNADFPAEDKVVTNPGTAEEVAGMYQDMYPDSIVHVKKKEVPRSSQDDDYNQMRWTQLSMASAKKEANVKHPLLKQAAINSEGECANCGEKKFDEQGRCTNCDVCENCKGDTAEGECPNCDYCPDCEHKLEWEPSGTPDHKRVRKCMNPECRRYDLTLDDDPDEVEIVDDPMEAYGLWRHGQ
jgi:hypothetical protein